MLPPCSPRPVPPLLTACLAAASLLACTPDQTAPPTAVDLSALPVRWTLDPHLDLDQVRVGVDWNLGLLGALPPADGSHLTLSSDGTVVTGQLDLALAGFPDASLPALTDALVELRGSDALDQLGSVDLGRLFMLTLHEPWRYYSISGACRSFGSWRQHRLVAAPDRYDVVTSLLAGGDRIILLPPADEAVSDLAMSIGTDAVPFGDAWVPEEFETLDLMANGQQRFATFDAFGDPQAYANPDVVPAGQPGRCIWCHEGNLMYGTSENPSSQQAIDYVEWETRIFAWQDQLDAVRAGLDTSIVYDDRDSHTWGERVVRDFLLPTVDRAAAEWGVDADEAWALIDQHGLWTQHDEEWAERGEVLTRADVDAVLEQLQDLALLPVLDDAREPPEGQDLRGEPWRAWLDCGGATPG